MSKKDATESDWTGWFNQRFGSGITRRNTAIYTPIVQNMTIPLIRYNDGTVNPPKVVREWGHTHPSSEGLINDDISYKDTSKDPFVGLDTNPNYKGDGRFFPEYHKHGVYYDYPEWTPGVPTRLKAPQQRREFPLELRRRLY
jgi:hypothetical protein